MFIADQVPLKSAKSFTLCLMTIMGITGGSGAGKTYILNQLRGVFPPSELCILSQDEYYHPRSDQITDDLGYFNFDVPEALDLDGMVSDIRTLKEGKTITKKTYTFNNESPKREISYIPAKVLLIEGLFLTSHPGLFQLIDFLFFVHTHEDIKLIRRIKRDMSDRNYPLTEILHRYEHHVMPAYRQHIMAIRESADIVINNNGGTNKGLEVVKGFISSRI